MVNFAQTGENNVDHIFKNSDMYIFPVGLHISPQPPAGIYKSNRRQPFTFYTLIIIFIRTIHDRGGG